MAISSRCMPSYTASVTPTAWSAGDGGELVGGLYGVSLGAAFFGESMFSRKSDASKVALVHLVERLRAGGYALLDTQFVTDAFEQDLAPSSCRVVPILSNYGAALERQATFYPFDSEFSSRDGAIEHPNIINRMLQRRETRGSRRTSSH